MGIELCLAIPSENGNDFVEGMVFEISGEELLQADKYEVEDYRRISVTLESGKKAWIYISADQSAVWEK